MHRQWTAIASHELSQPLPPVTTQRFKADDALREEQALDAIDVPDPLDRQHLALAAQEASVFLGAMREFG